jgi:hypothetical protein
MLWAIQRSSWASIYWHLTPCRMVNCNRRCSVTYCLNIFTLPWRDRQPDPTKLPIMTASSQIISSPNRILAYANFLSCKCKTEPATKNQAPPVEKSPYSTLSMTNCSHVFTLNLFTKYNLVIYFWCFNLRSARCSTECFCLPTTQTR